MGVKGALIGIVLLLCTFAAVRWLINSTPASTNPQNNPNATKEDERPPDRVIAWGNFDVEPGINRALFPRQYGRIDKLIPENTKVNAGDVLLQVDDAMAQLKVKQAELAVKAAMLQRDEAGKLPELYKLQAAQQQASLNSVEKEIEELKRERDRQLRQLGEKDPVYKTVVERYQFGLDKLEEKKKAEKARLDQIGLQDPKLKYDQADAEVKAKEAQREEAKEALNYFKVVAPGPGYVLRVNVKKGDVLGANPTMPALEFMPEGPIIVRAEVLQEWGRYVKVDQEVEIEDDVYKGPTWQGRVKSLSKWYAPTRTPIIEPFRYNDVRTLECFIDLKETKDMPVARVGQRVRAKIKINGK
jgi:biotin carboxyl carrier protein